MSFFRASCIITITLCLLLSSLFSKAQDNYEIQVYGSELVPQNCTMFELHSNYTIHGFTDTVDGVLPTNRALHETVEITHGFTPWLEVGFYQFTAFTKDKGFAYVGNHLRPRIAAPDSWKWPFGASISFECGYQQKNYSPDTWTLEVRPILDKKTGRWYFSINPAIDYSFAGASHSQGLVFSPDAKVSFKFAPWLEAGFEYYNSMGPFSSIYPINQQPHQLALCFDFDFSADWELNVGYVKGLTPYVESDIVKVIIGRRIGKPAIAPVPNPENHD